MNAAVVVQETQVQQIDTAAAQTNEHVSKANEELTGAVDKSRAARRKKWICLGIVGKSQSPFFKLRFSSGMQRSSSIEMRVYLTGYFSPHFSRYYHSHRCHNRHCYCGPERQSLRY